MLGSLLLGTVVALLCTLFFKWFNLHTGKGVVDATVGGVFHETVPFSLTAC